jgi:signal transduction histidine kinase
LQEEAENIKVHTLDITRNMHLLDMAVRSYALVNKPRFHATIDSAFLERERIFESLEKQLKHQHYPMHEFYALRDSIVKYYVLVDTMRNYILRKEEKKFLQVLDQDPGYVVWLKYKTFSDHAYAFEDRIVEQAKAGYQQALNNIYWLQVILFLITMPTLSYSAYYAFQALRISERLRKSEEHNSHILEEQKTVLEVLVSERTAEIQAQNEQLQFQQKILSEQHEKLQEAKEIIEDQNIRIQKQNEELVLEVNRQTQDIKTANLELIQQNNRLEEFNFIISHNIRAPLARLIGLATILDYSKGPDEVSQIVNMMVDSTNDLDEVIKDLAFMLEIQQVSTQVLSKVNLHDVLNKTIQRLESSIKKTKAEITINFPSPITLNSLPQYLDSIFYNLVSNALKYRHPERTPVIKINVTVENEFIRIDVQDNGLGVDLEKYGDKLFTLYKRFHFHVEGKGFGLFLIKTQVNTLGGKIEVQSKVEEGSIFSVFLKLTTVDGTQHTMSG